MPLAVCQAVCQASLPKFDRGYWTRLPPAKSDRKDLASCSRTQPAVAGFGHLTNFGCAAISGSLTPNREAPRPDMTMGQPSLAGSCRACYNVYNYLIHNKESRKTGNRIS